MPTFGMQFLTIRELSKSPKNALSKLAQDGKAVLTNNGKPAAIMFNVNTENFEQVFNFVQEVEKNNSVAFSSVINERERSQAFERLLSFPRKKVPHNFNYKKEFLEAIDERFNSTN